MLNADNTKSEAAAWAKKHKFGFPLVMLSELNKKSAMYKYYTGSFPTYVLIDKDGKVVARGYRDSVAYINKL